MGLDAAGAVALFLLPGGSAIAAIAGAAIGTVGIGAALAEQDAPAGAAAYTGKQAAVAEGLFRGASTQIARRFGVAALTASTLYDIGKATADYQACMQGKAE